MAAAAAAGARRCLGDGRCEPPVPKMDREMLVLGLAEGGERGVGGRDI